MITGFDSNISDTCNIHKYYSELRRKLKAYTMLSYHKSDTYFPCLFQLQSIHFAVIKT